MFNKLSAKSIDNKFLVINAIIIITLIYLSLAYIYEYYTQPYTWDPEAIPDEIPKTQCVLFTSYDQAYYDKNEFVKLNAEIISRYCDLHGHKYLQIIHPQDFMSPYWTRVHDIQKLCEKYPDNTIFMYLDADAIPNGLNKHVSLDAFVASIDKIYNNSECDIYISEDPNVIMPWYGGIFNTGCFIVRNTMESRDFINKWLSRYNNGFTWKQNQTGKWVCEINSSDCSWSLDGYDQGEFNNLYLQIKEGCVLKLNYRILAQTKPYEKDNYIIHLMGSSNKHRIKVFKDQLDRYYTD